MNNAERPPKFFFLNLKKNVSKHGVPFYTGKLAYAMDLIAFEKKDGSGDLTVWMQPKDMDQMNQRKQAPPQQQRPPPPQRQPPPQQGPPPYPEDDDLPF